MFKRLPQSYCCFGCFQSLVPETSFLCCLKLIAKLLPQFQHPFSGLFSSSFFQIPDLPSTESRESGQKHIQPHVYSHQHKTIFLRLCWIQVIWEEVKNKVVSGGGVHTCLRVWSLCGKESNVAQKRHILESETSITILMSSVGSTWTL